MVNNLFVRAEIKTNKRREQKKIMMSLALESINNKQDEEGTATNQN